MSTRRLLLPLFHVALATALSLWGVSDYQRRYEGADVLDFVPLADRISQGLNFPAALVIALATKDSFFRIGLAFSPAAFAAYLVLVAILWLSVAWYTSAGNIVPRHFRTMTGVLGVGFLLAGGALVSASDISLFVPLGGLAWGFVLTYASRSRGRAANLGEPRGPDLHP